MVVISISNQKGGTGKTTTTIFLSYLLAQKNYKVLAIDTDPQASLTKVLGYTPRDVEGKDLSTIYEEAVKQYESNIEGYPEINVKEYAIRTKFHDTEFDFLASSLRLNDIANRLKELVESQFMLKWILDSVRSKYDIILIDNPPSTGILVVNSLVSADYVLAPVELTPLGLSGFTDLIGVVSRVKRSYNRELKWLGVLPTKFEKKNRDMKYYYTELKQLLEKAGIRLFNPVPKSVLISRMFRDEYLPDIIKNVKTANEVLKSYEMVINAIVEVV